MLVVLPFENLTAGERYDYFSEGLTEEMITELARLSPERLGVIARTSAMQFKSTTKSIAQIGSELGVSHVLEGSVRRVGERVRITAQLIRVSDESHLWAQSYERGLHDVLEVQAEVARAVAREIQIKLTPHEQRRLDPDKTRSINSQAYELYLRGRHFWYRRTEEGIRKSIECFEEALRYDPSFAAAYDGISDAHTMLACRGMTPAVESFHKAKTAARQAVRLQPELGEGYASLAHVRLHDWDWVGLESDFRQAVELDPGYAIAHYWYAEYLMAMGRTREALGRVEHAWELDPLNSVINASVGMIRYLAHDYDGALVALRRGLEIDPTHYVSYLRSGARVPAEEPAERSDRCDAAGGDAFRRQHRGSGGTGASARCHGRQARHGEDREGARRKRRPLCFAVQRRKSLWGDRRQAASARMAGESLPGTQPGSHRADSRALLRGPAFRREIPRAYRSNRLAQRDSRSLNPFFYAGHAWDSRRFWCIEGFRVNRRFVNPAL